MNIILKPKVEKSILYFGEFGSEGKSIIKKISNEIRGQIVFEAKNNLELLEIVKMVNIDLLLIDSSNIDDNTIKSCRKVFDLRKEIKLLLFNSQKIRLGLILIEESKETVITKFYTEKILLKATKKIILKENYNWG